jgi:tetratricopeptide (TPR) repeat protein
MEKIKSLLSFALGICLTSTTFKVLSDSMSVESDSKLPVSVAANTIPADSLRADEKPAVTAAIAVKATETADKKPLDSIYSSPAVWKEIADIESEQKHYQIAIEALKHAINLQPKNAPISQNAPLYVSLSEIYAVTSQYKEALTAIDQALKIESRNIDYLNRRVMLANWAGEYDQVEDTYKRILNIESKNQMARVGLQNIETEKAKAKLNTNTSPVLLAEAAAITTAAVAPVVEPPPAPDEGIAAEEEKNWDKAIGIYKEEILKDSNRPDLWKRIADIESEQKHYQNAIDALKNAINLQPKNVALYVNLSETYAVTNQAKEALAAINQALQIEPMNVDYLNRRVILANWAGEDDQVEDSYKRILNIEPNNELARVGLENIQAQKAKDKADAEAELKANAKLPAPETAEIKSPTAVEKTTDTATPVDGKPPVSIAETTEAGGAEKNRGSAVSADTEAVANSIKALKNDINNLGTTAAKSNANKSPNDTQGTLKTPSITDENVVGATYNGKLGAFDENTPGETKGKIGAVDESVVGATYNGKLGIFDENTPGETKGKIGVVDENAPGATYANQAQKYAEANRPEEAIVHVNLALKKEPKNIAYNKLRAEIAMEEKNYEQAEKSYSQILQINPYNKDGLLGMANLEVARNNLDAAVCAYESYLSLYPDSKTVWLDYAKLQSWRGNYVAAFRLIKKYKEHYGETYEYLSVKARLFEMSGYPEHALALVKKLLIKSPNDYEVLFTEAAALEMHREPTAAMEALCEIERKFPNNVDNKYLRNAILIPPRPTLSLDGYFSHDSDNIKMFSSGMHGEYFITPETSMIYGFKQENLTAIVGSGLDTIDGKGTTWDSAQWVGLTHQISPELAFSGLGGLGEIKKNSNFFRYDLNLITTPNDYIQIAFQKGQDIFAMSPRTVSLRILQKYNRISIYSQPYPQKYLEIGAEYDTFSDKNKLKSLSLYPHANVLASQYVDIDLGPYANWQNFSLQIPDNGYYDPRSSQLYQALGHITFKQSENVNYVLTLGAGTQKDETMLKPGFAGDVALRAIYGIYADWFLNIQASAAARNSGSLLEGSGNKYRVYTIEALLTKRF